MNNYPTDYLSSDVSTRAFLRYFFVVGIPPINPGQHLAMTYLDVLEGLSRKSSPEGPPILRRNPSPAKSTAFSCSRTHRPFKQSCGDEGESQTSRWGTCGRKRSWGNTLILLHFALLFLKELSIEIFPSSVIISWTSARKGDGLTERDVRRAFFFARFLH